MPISALNKKLKLKTGQLLLTINTPDDYGRVLDYPFTELKSSSFKKENFDQVHLFVKNQAELTKWSAKALSALKQEGIIWIMFPKKTSKVQSDLTRDKGWDQLLATATLQMVTLISIDDIWSSMAFKKTAAIIKPRKSQQDNQAVISQYIDTENRIIKIPLELQKLFKQYPIEKVFFNSLSFTNRKEYVVWLITAKLEDTKQKRLVLIVNKLKKKLKSPTQKDDSH